MSHHHPEIVVGSPQITGLPEFAMIGNNKKGISPTAVLINRSIHWRRGVNRSARGTISNELRWVVMAKPINKPLNFGEWLVSKDQRNIDNRARFKA
jgi:hypothetical protein